MVAKKTVPAGKAETKSAPGKKAVPAKTATAKAAADDGTAKTNAETNAETAAKTTAKTTARKTTRKAAAETTAAKKTASANAKKTASAKKTSPRKTVSSNSKKTAPRKTVPQKSTATKPAPAKKAVPAEKTGARTLALKKTPGGALPAGGAPAPAADAVPNAVPKARGGADPGELAVRPGEDPWTSEEVAAARSELHDDAERLRGEILASEAAITRLMRDSGDGAGDDEADTGSKNITREHELALATIARERLQQTERALDRLDAGTYGLCESCGKPIGKARTQAFPRATLCVECKQRQERR